MKIISFDIAGKFGHFRKFYGNNTAFTFAVPPRTTIMGMLAAMMGWEKESYHEKLSVANIRIGVRVMQPIKKSFHRLNFLKILGSNDFRGKNGRVQTPFEVISGLNPRTDEIRYRIYLSPGLDEKTIFDEMAKRIKERNFTYNVSLGTANFSARVENYLAYPADKIKELVSDEFQDISSAVMTDDVTDLDVDQTQRIMIEEELTPLEFTRDYDRSVASMKRILYPLENYAMRIKTDAETYRIQSAAETITISFLE